MDIVSQHTGLIDRQAEVAWKSRGLCAGVPTEWFFPESPEDITRAKSICANCPVKAPCEKYARSREEYGVWGGTTEDERRRWGSSGNGGCPACSGPMITVSGQQEQCLVCHLTWHASL